MRVRKSLLSFKPRLWKGTRKCRAPGSSRAAFPFSYSGSASRDRLHRNPRDWAFTVYKLSGKITSTEEACPLWRELRLPACYRGASQALRTKKRNLGRKRESNYFSLTNARGEKSLKPTHDHSEFLFRGTDGHLEKFIEAPCIFSYRMEKWLFPPLSVNHLKQSWFLTDLVLQGSAPS